MHNPLPISLFILLAAAFTANVATALGTMGGRIQIPDTQSNKEIEDLGKFSVNQYNYMQEQKLKAHTRRQAGGGSAAAPTPLEFESVIAAEKQVVAGIKYYLTIRAKEGTNAKTFTVELVVNPNKKSKEILISFSPSPSPSSSQDSSTHSLGGFEEVNDAKENTEVQEAGKLAVEQFNENSMNGVSKPLVFQSTVKAMRQHVDGVKYRLRIFALHNGVSEPFEAEVFVSPNNKSMELTRFQPGAADHHHMMMKKVVDHGGVQSSAVQVMENVKQDKEVQELGRFAVEEFNEKGVSRRLVFEEVVKAERQVVGGTKYYMKVRAHEDGVTKWFHVEVLVQTGSKRLLRFAPASS